MNGLGLGFRQGPTGPVGCLYNGTTTANISELFQFTEAVEIPEKGGGSVPTPPPGWVGFFYNTDTSKISYKNTSGSVAGLADLDSTFYGTNGTLSGSGDRAVTMANKQISFDNSGGNSAQANFLRMIANAGDAGMSASNGSATWTWGIDTADSSFALANAVGIGIGNAITVANSTLATTLGGAVTCSSTLKVTDVSTLTGGAVTDAQAGVVLRRYGALANQTGELRFVERDGEANYVGFKAPDALAGDYVWTLPTNTDAGVLSNTDGSTLQWTEPSYVTVGTSSKAQYTSVQAAITAGYKRILIIEDITTASTTTFGTGIYTVEFSDGVSWTISATTPFTATNKLCVHFIGNLGYLNSGYNFGIILSGSTSITMFSGITTFGNFVSFDNMYIRATTASTSVDFRGNTSLPISFVFRNSSISATDTLNFVSNTGGQTGSFRIDNCFISSTNTQIDSLASDANMLITNTYFDGNNVNSADETTPKTFVGCSFPGISSSWSDTQFSGCTFRNSGSFTPTSCSFTDCVFKTPLTVASCNKTVFSRCLFGSTVTFSTNMNDTHINECQCSGTFLHINTAIESTINNVYGDSVTSVTITTSINSSYKGMRFPSATLTLGGTWAGGSSFEDCLISATSISTVFPDNFTNCFLGNVSVNGTTSISGGSWSGVNLNTLTVASGTSTFQAKVTNSVFQGAVSFNKFAGSLINCQFISTCSFQDNVIANSFFCNCVFQNAITANGSVADAVWSNCKFRDVTFNSTATDVKFANCTMEIGCNYSTCTQLILDSCIFDSTVTLAGAINDCTISGCDFTGTFTVQSTVDNFTIVGCKFKGQVLFNGNANYLTLSDSEGAILLNFVGVTNSSLLNLRMDLATLNLSNPANTYTHENNLISNCKFSATSLANSYLNITNSLLGNIVISGSGRSVGGYWSNVTVGNFTGNGAYLFLKASNCEFEAINNVRPWNFYFDTCQITSFSQTQSYDIDQSPTFANCTFSGNLTVGTSPGNLCKYFISNCNIGGNVDFSGLNIISIANTHIKGTLDLSAVFAEIYLDNCIFESSSVIFVGTTTRISNSIFNASSALTASSISDMQYIGNRVNSGVTVNGSLSSSVFANCSGNNSITFLSVDQPTTTTFSGCTNSFIAQPARTVDSCRFVGCLGTLTNWDVNETAGNSTDIYYGELYISSAATITFGVVNTDSTISPTIAGSLNNFTHSTSGILTYTGTV